MKVIIVHLFLSFALLFSEEIAIKLVTDDNFIPYSYLENGEVIGYDIDVIRELEKRLEIKITIEALPWRRVISMISSGLADGGFSLFKTEEREYWSIFSKYPVHTSRYSIFTRKGHEFKFNNISDLIGKKIGINSGFVINDEFDEMKINKSINVIESEDFDINFKLLEKGRIDCYIGNYFTSLYKINLDDSAGSFSMLQKNIVPSRDAFLVFSKKSDYKDLDSLIIRINNIMEDLYNDGTIDSISKKYIGF